MRLKRIVTGLIATLFTSMLLNIGLFMLPAAASGGPYDWPMHGYDPACTSFSPSTAPNTNTTAWVAGLPGGTVWAYPVVAEGKVFIGAGGYLNAFDENTGGLVWRFRALDQPGYPCCSAVADGRVFFGTGEPGPGGAMYALNTTTGDQIWNFTTEAYLRTPVVVDDRLYFGVDTDAPDVGKIYCLNAATGEHIWNYTTQDKGVTIAVAYGKVYAGCGHWITSAMGRVYCLDMYDGSYVWGFQTNKDITGTVSVANGKVYFSASYEGWDCMVYALNATNGDAIWSITRYSHGAAAGTAVAYGKVFIGLGYSDRGVYALNETNGDEIWAFPTSQNSGGGPIVADGKVFFASGYPGHMFYAFNETTGTVIWSYRLIGDVHSWSSAVAHGRVFVADHWDPKLYAFGEPYSGTVYTLSITTTIGGTTIPSSGIYTYTPGISVQVTAIPNTGYQLDHWELDTANVGAANPYTVLIDKDQTLKAVFSPIPPPLSVSISPLSASIYMGQSVSFTSTAGGGTPPYYYQWYLGNNPFLGATLSGWTFTPIAPGTFTIYLNVTDSLGNSAKSNEATVTVASQLSASISPTSASILVGQSITFTSTVSGGYIPYSYQWYLNGAPVSGAASASWTFTPTASGIYYVYLKVTDAKANTSQSDTARIAVASVPVGGYSLPIQVQTKTEPIILYIASITILTTLFTKLRRKTKRKH